uniref:RNB domain-containing protein n=1 Tax=Sinocyclocheilus anshuiensis TaxID=1608454 RepID=A0A671K3S5_9TELE
MTFPGDEVVVETGRDEGSRTGRVLGFTNRRPTSSEFVCFLENENYHKRTQNTDKNFGPKIMIPLNHNTTKICILTKKETRNYIPVWKYTNGNWTITRNFRVDEQIKQNYVFVVQILDWKEHCSFPLGRVMDILPTGTSLEEGLEILKSEFKLTPPLLQEDTFPEMKADGIEDEKRRDFRGLQTFTIDPPTARDLDDAISVNNLRSCCEIGVHVADVASFVSKDSSLDSFAKEMGATFYDPGKEPTFMFPKHFATTFWSLLTYKDRKSISLIVTVEKQTGIIIKRSFYLSKVKSKKQLTYKEAEYIISQCDGELRFDTLEDCKAASSWLIVLHLITSKRLSGHGDSSSPADLRSSEDSKCRLMMEELMLMFQKASDQLINQETPFPNIFSYPVTASPELVRRLKRDNEELGSLHALEERLDSNIGQNSGSFIFLTSVWQKIESAALTYASLGHYSLNLDSYTHASSPIRRYIDVVLQRLMHAVLSDCPVEYSQTDIDLLCDKCKRGEMRAREYENKAESLCLAVNLQKQSAYKVAFVTVVRHDSESFILSFPFDKGTIFIIILTS